MCDFIRGLVSGSSRRYIDNKFNLDLSYITDRVIAMSYPASGFESAYRNHIDKVSEFLNLKHPKNYKVYNICGRDYKTNKFSPQPTEIYREWKDHYSPPLSILITIIKSMYEFLSANENNVVAIHCNAGKGRTGVAISCLLMYCHYIQSAAASLEFYSFQRFGSNRGVSHPCQLRYVQYFEKLLSKKCKYPIAKILKKIIITTIPKFSKDGLRPFIVIEGMNRDKLPPTYRLYSSRVEHKKQTKYFFADAENDQYMIMKICPDISIMLIDDVIMYLYHNGIHLSRPLF